MGVMPNRFNSKLFFHQFCELNYLFSNNPQFDSLPVIMKSPFPVLSPEFVCQVVKWRGIPDYSLQQGVESIVQEWGKPFRQQQRLAESRCWRSYGHQVRININNKKDLYCTPQIVSDTEYGYKVDQVVVKVDPMMDCNLHYVFMTCGFPHYIV